MDANSLLHYLRGFFELVEEPTPAQIRAIRNEVLRAQPVEAQLIPVEVVNPTHRVVSSGSGGCGGDCGKPVPGVPRPPPYLDPSKFS